MTLGGFAQAGKATPSPSPAPSAEPVETVADRDYAAFEALARAMPPGPPQEMGALPFFTWVNQQLLKINAAGLTFYQAYPSDPRRWDVALVLLGMQPLFATGFGPDVATQGAGAAIVDPQAKDAWDKRAEELKQELLAADDAPVAGKERIEWGYFARDFRSASSRMRTGEPVDWGHFRSRFDAHVKKYADFDIVVARATDYLGALDQNVPGLAQSEWNHLADTSANEALRAKAKEQVETAEMMSRPLEMAFTAADGRKVDLADYRGKVVLIDFWATWCGPCIAEIPNIKRVYADYHDKGFEIVGISLENAKLTPGDSSEQITSKLEAARKKLREFTAKEGMPWPQYFDGKWWDNDISTKYAITSIPAMFLIDREGRVATTQARGEKLESEVKRLLGL